MEGGINMAIDNKSPETIGAGHGYGGMLLQVEEVYNDEKTVLGQPGLWVAL
jgi:hypothetical protein